jgi:hypothetical protein
MAKLSALVIPAVIDTSGVDKGISQIKSKLSRVGGGGGVGGVGGGLTPGHSAGVVPYGVGTGYGSGASAAMAAAFGAAAGQRAMANVGTRNLATGNLPLPRGTPRAVANRYNQNNPISSIMSDFAANAFARRNAYGVKGLGSGYMGPVEGPFAGGRQGLDAVYQAKVSIPNAAAAQRAHMAGKAWTRRATSLGMWYSNQKYLPQGLGASGMSLGGVGKMLGIGAGIGAAYETMQHFNPENVQQRWNTSISRYAGTSSYAPLARLKQKAEIAQSEYMGFGQAFDVGGQMAAGEYGTTFTERMSNAWGAFATTTGQLAGAATTNPMYAGAMVTMPGASPALHAKMTEGIETAVGMGLLAVENTFKKLFN